jgi:hypothetical protein
MSRRPEAGLPSLHLQDFAGEPLLGGSCLPCRPLVGCLQSRQKQRLGDIRVKLQ